MWRIVISLTVIGIGEGRSNAFGEEREREGVEGGASYKLVYYNYLFMPLAVKRYKMEGWCLNFILSFKGN